MNEPNLDHSHTPSVNSVDRILSIVELIATMHKGVSLSDLARRLQIPKSSCHCLVLTLERRGYLLRNPTSRRYTAGANLVRLGNAALTGLSLRESAKPFLRQLMSGTSLTVHLAILDHDNALVVDRISPSGHRPLASWVGKRWDLHCSGVGKALLAYLPEERFSKIIQQNALTRYNENTITSPMRLVTEAAQIRKMGYAIDDEEGEIGFRCIGAPIFDNTRGVVAAISLSGTTHQIDETNTARYSGQVIGIAKQISSQIRHQPLLSIA